MSIYYFTQAVWECDIVLSADFLVLWLKTSIWKAPFYRLPSYVLANNWKSAYYFILYHRKLLFVIVFIIFLWKRYFFVLILILYMNLQTILLSIKSTSRILILLIITNNSISTKQHSNNYLSVSAPSTKQPIDNRGQPISVKNIGLFL